ncbi:MAG TPA: hypothetical protein PKA63_14065 [Oligoflexia bacterium]|nr:hypothetical protein [Oligoflexia bacterium]HMP49789.1 hypothetical protein [Oligoflexia bacterium]
MDITSFGTQQIIDIGFGLLVIGICVKTLLTDRDRLGKERARWKEELEDLQHSLQSLIADAADASQVFDKRIQRRTSELDALIRRAERSVAEARKVSSSFDENGFARSDSNLLAEPFDPPWAQMVDGIPERKSAGLLETDILEETVKKTKRRPAVEKEVQKNTKGDIRTPLQSQIEMQSEQEARDEEVFRQTSIVDPVAFRIAKRLLLEGKEIHIVARKLELPVSEIRHLDSLLRQEAQKVNLPLPPALAEREIVNVRGIVRDPVEKKRGEYKGGITVRASADSVDSPLVLEMEKEEDFESEDLLF